MNEKNEAFFFTPFSRIRIRQRFVFNVFNSKFKKKKKQNE